MEEVDNKKYLLFSIIGVILIVISVSCVTLAFLSNKTSLSDKSMTVVKTDDLVVQYDKGTDISIGDIKPGKTISKKIVVKNNSTGALNYDIKWVYTENNFNEKDLVYNIEFNGNANKEKKVPSTGVNIPIIKNVTIEKNMTHAYVINIKHSLNGKRNKTNSFKGKIEVKLNKESVKD